MGEGQGQGGFSSVEFEQQLRELESRINDRLSPAKDWVRETIVTLEFMVAYLESHEATQGCCLGTVMYHMQDGKAWASRAISYCSRIQRVFKEAIQSLEENETL